MSKNWHLELNSKIHFADFYPKGTQTGPNQINVICKFHEETTPSLSINLGTGQYFCQSCSAKGNFLTWCKELNIDMKQLAIENGIETDEKGIDPQEVEEAHEKLMNTAVALKWFKDKRGITKTTLKKYKIGMKENQSYIPIYDVEKKIVNIRKYNPNPPKDRPKMTSYQKGYGSARLYPFENLYKKEIIICEGEMDAILLNQLGFFAVTGTAGVNSFPDEWAKYFSGKYVVICFDIDEIGRIAAEKVSKILKKFTSTIKVIRVPLDEKEYPHGDITDYIVLENHTKQDIDQIIFNTPFISRIGSGDIYKETTLLKSSLEEFTNKTVTF